MRFCRYSKPFDRPIRISRRGNSIAEYAVIGVLGVAVVIVGLQAASGNLNQIFNLFKTDMSAHAQASDLANAQNAQAKGAFSAASSSVLQVSPKPAPVPALPPPPNATAASAVTQTVGSNGTQVLVQAITDTAKQSLAAGSISQSEYNLIVAVANKGHDIATMQGLLESAYQQSSGNSTTYSNTVVSYNGQSYTPDQLNAVLTTTVNDFSNLKVQASAQVGVMNDLNLLTVLNDSGANIINNGYVTQQQNQSAASYIQYQTESPSGGSTDTHQQSATICTTGQASDTGTNCSP